MIVPTKDIRYHDYYKPAYLKKYIWHAIDQLYTQVICYIMKKVKQSTMQYIMLSFNYLHCLICVP